MTQRWKAHDKVSWQTPQGETHGRVTRVITTQVRLDGHAVSASPSDPHYEVESAKSGKRAVHRGDALKHQGS